MLTTTFDTLTSPEIIILLGQKLLSQNMFFATAESCTGGLVAEECTNISGSSAWFVGGVVAYANHVKQNVLGVQEEHLINYGAVSEAVVRDMAEGVCRIMNAQCSIAISGVAGPTGGTPDKPVGTVWIAASICKSQNTTTVAHCFHFDGTRNDVRHAATKAALIMILELFTTQN